MADKNQATTQIYESMQVPQTFFQYVLWTTIAFLALYAVAVILTVYLSSYFHPQADFYDDCKATNFKFKYLIKIKTKDLPISFLEGKNSIVVMLGNGETWTSRWELRLRNRESAIVKTLRKKKTPYRLKFTIGRNALLNDVKAIRLDHTLFGKEIKIETIEIYDLTRGLTLINLSILQPIAMLRPVCSEDQRQVFVTTMAEFDDTPTSNDKRLRAHINSLEYVVFFFAAVSIILILSIDFPNHPSQLANWMGVKNGIVSTLIATVAVFTFFAVYKLVLKVRCDSNWMRNAVLCLLSAMTIGLSVFACLKSKRMSSTSSSYSSPADPSAWWFGGFVVGVVTLLALSAFSNYVLSLITDRLYKASKPPATTHNDDVEKNSRGKVSNAVNTHTSSNHQQDDGAQPQSVKEMSQTASKSTKTKM